MSSLRSCSWLFLGLLAATGLPLRAQLDPENAQTILYFPHVTDGGSAAQQWATGLTFVNPHVSIPAFAIASFYGDDGKSLALDFGAGPVTTVNFTVPPQGRVSYKTTGLSTTTVVGWAVLVSTLPLQAVAQLSYAVNGVPQQGVAAQPTSASSIFRSPAAVNTGIALVNTNSGTSIAVRIQALDGSGNLGSEATITVPPNGHRSFTVGQIMPVLETSFQGTVVMSANANYFVAWALSDDSGVLSSYPPSGLRWPISHNERIWNVWFKLLNAALAVSALNSPPTLIVDYSTGQINSFADPSKNAVHIFMNLAELISDSESELAFVIAHEIGHIIQSQKRQLIFVPNNAEEDADEYGVFLGLMAGYDPYGGAGALAKLAMASGQAGLVSQVFDNLSTDPHGSFNNRLSLMFIYMQAVCSLPIAQQACAQYKSVIHPHLPPVAPLISGGR